MSNLANAALAAALSLLPLPGLAHIHLQPESAQAGQVLDLALVVGHGCAGASTTALRVSLPAGVTAEPLAQPGWQPVTGKGEIGWQGGPLPDHEKARFVLRATLAADVQPLVRLPVIQTCGQTEQRWIDPEAGDDHPAPALTVLPAK
ncbi:DUF1775 domain-containing protein [Paracoccus sp. NGMCC 1.201697]|uniref:DUF1775 domain-containing protein n=1 Tax=Paracoccus broussonetiae subsp. drimophilus TaxID=3373869 RepID=A0ABW7LLA2_9RHOB